jgi:hypothetical protein
MSGDRTQQKNLQSLSTEEFFYFFLRLRKGEVRRTVSILRERYPTDTEQQLARRLLQSKIRLSLLGGALLNLPMLLPGVGAVIKMIGTVGATSVLTRLHLYLILEIALVYGKDIDDKARVTEMAAVAAVTGLGAAAPMLVKVLGMHPVYTLPAGALSASAATRIIGDTAIKLYSGKLKSHYMIMADILALYDVDDIFGQVAGMVTDAFDGADHEHGVNGVSDIAGVFQ